MKKRLEDFCKEYPDAQASLKFWYDVVTTNSFYTAQEVFKYSIQQTTLVTKDLFLT